MITRVLLLILGFTVFYTLILLPLGIVGNINTNNGHTNGTIETSHEYEEIIDPVTMKPIPICSSRGRELMQGYMVCYFEEYLEKTKNDWNYILPTQLRRMNLDNVYLLDVRKPEDYKAGHIPGSTNIFWLDLMKPENISKLPKDKEIIIICYVGHTASQVLVLLRLLGYKARVLKFGMGVSPQPEVPVAGWTSYGFQTET